MAEEGEETEAAKGSLFPLFAASVSASANTPQQNKPTNAPTEWLCNSSFTADLSLINAANSSLHGDGPAPTDFHESDTEDDPSRQRPQPTTSYEVLPEEERDDERYANASASESDSDRERRRAKRRNKKKRRRNDDKLSESRDFGSRKSNVRGWADADIKPPKDYYFDTHGDRDNLVYGGLYRMDVPYYRPYNPVKAGGFGFHGFYRSNQRSSVFDRDGDADALDTKLRSAGRYWSAKYAAVERHKNLKRLRLVAPIRPAVVASDDFIPLSDVHTSQEGVESGSFSRCLAIEESWEDEVLRKTREFNKLTREHPHDEKVWLDFAEFQDKVASMQPQKGARLQTLEKKISILEKATELNPDNEELLLSLLKAYQSRDSTDVLIGRWEKEISN